MNPKYFRPIRDMVTESVFYGVYGSPMKKLMGYLTDWRRERRIRYLTDCAVAFMIEGDLDKARSFDKARRDLINARSHEQVVRMEQRMGLR